MISVDNLVYEYPTKRALHGVSFHLEAATVTALVGPNGAGKTTLLRCLAALEHPFAGRVAIAGMTTVEMPRDVHRRLGYLSDFFGLYDDLSVQRCLTFAAMSHGIIDNLPTVVNRAAERLGLLDRLAENASSLSRGLRQRLAIAQAIIHEPSVLLLDEPASGLDPEARISLSRLLAELRTQGLTLVVSSHILAELEAYSTHMLMIRDGRITGHQTLSSYQPADQPMALRLLAPDPRLAEILTAEAGISSLEVREESAEFRLTGGDEQRARILQILIEQGLEVAQFGPVKQSMEDVYLADIDTESGGEGRCT